MENNHIGTLHIAYGVVGQSLLTKLMPLCPAIAVHKYNFIYISFIIFYISFYKEYTLKPFKNKAFLLNLSVFRNKQKMDILDIKS